MWNGVKNALCILWVAVELGCPQIVTACVRYMESVPWEEGEEDEEEILKVIPGIGTTSRADSRLFNSLIETLLHGSEELDFEVVAIWSFHSYLRDLLWACQILAKLETLRDVVKGWIEVSEKMVKVVEKMSEKGETIETRLKVIEVTATVLEAIGGGGPIIDKMEGQVWQTLELAFVSIILTLPLMDQAEILTGWLREEHIQYPDLSKAFEVWCYWSKVANKRFSSLG
ncbi:hypothetical protein LguiB_013512 [Lonicera macranthoides]